MQRSPVDPLILCYDGSEDAKYAVAKAGNLFPGEHALVLTFWEPMANLGSFAWSGAATIVNFAELDRAAAEHGDGIVAEGVGLAREAGLKAEPLAVEADGPVWQTIIETVDHRQAAIVVMGSRGLTSLRSILLGSVSSAVVHHARRPVLVIHPPGEVAPQN